MNLDLNWFLIGPIPSNVMSGSYNYRLVALSYVIAVMASYVALDLAGRLRATTNNRVKFYWLVGGAFAMGAGIWSMHFIGMLAFIMNMPMHYDIFWTASSMVAAIIASGFTMYLLRTEGRPLIFMALGGIFLGIGICTMHYMGMTGMEGVRIRYLPSLFFLSVVIAIASSWAALWLALQTNEGTLWGRFRLKLMSALVMGAGICGMHYTGMAAAVFFHTGISGGLYIEPNSLALYVASVSALIIGLALIVSTYQQLVDNALQKEKERNLEQQLVIARQAGMAEVADCVLHNVGNVLNSVNISVSMLAEKLTRSELDNLSAVKAMVEEHKQDFPEYISKNEKGSHLPDYLIALSNYWQEEKEIILQEVQTLVKNVQHIKDIITMQQALSKVIGAEEMISIEALLEDALQISGTNFEHYGIKVEQRHEKIPPILLDKSKVMQIIINLIRNAKDALNESSKRDKILSIVSGLKDNKQEVFVQVCDNGIGISSENLTRIFNHGFTTKKTGHGFGLHTSAIVAKEIGGNLKVESEGREKGAIFTLELPTDSHKNNRCRLTSPPHSPRRPTT